jgi:sulfite exporter TauE/SafE
MSGADSLPLVHEVLRLFAALVIIAAGLYLTGWVPRLKLMDRLGEPLWRRLEPLGRRLLPVRSMVHALLFGLVWGWLPCGLVYYALLLTLAAESGLQDAIYMLGFGLGTLPALAVTGSATGWLAGIARRRILQQAMGSVLVAVGIIGLWFGKGIP